MARDTGNVDRELNFAFLANRAHPGTHSFVLFRSLPFSCFLPVSFLFSLLGCDWQKTELSSSKRLASSICDWLSKSPRARLATCQILRESHLRSFCFGSCDVSSSVPSLCFCCWSSAFAYLPFASCFFVFLLLSVCGLCTFLSFDLLLFAVCVCFDFRMFVECSLLAP